MPKNTKTFHYCWEYDLKSDPSSYWPLVTDTNRFNRDTGLPTVANLGKNDSRLANARRRLRFFRLGIPVTWIEEPFQWERPYRFGVVRTYSSGPVAEMRVQADLLALPGGGTHLTYKVWAAPRNLLGWVAIPLQIGLVSAAAFKRTFLEYDRRAQQGLSSPVSKRPQLVPGGGTRLVRLREELVSQGVTDELASRLAEAVSRADDFEAANMRPYAWADRWQMNRRAVLEMFLVATRLGILDFSWHLLCPSCRVARETAGSLRLIPAKVHCDTCLIDYEVNFDQCVELTFRPNPSIREVALDLQYCIAGPQVTPHIVAQQLLPGNSQRSIYPLLENGRYRLRVLGTSGAHYFRVDSAGQRNLHLAAPNFGEGRELLAASQPEILLENNSPEEALFILERVAWSDVAVTAAEVTALQKFRDLFANEALRPGDQFAVGRLAIAFTDLRQSTRMYRTIGDAPAFGQVMSHFDILKAAIESHNGALIKTIGDAVMAVFKRPADAFNAMLRAQAELASPADGSRQLELKVGLHFGPCIAVNLNDRLDYFGTTVNFASRLVELSSGRNLIVSDEFHEDPEVAVFLEDERYKGRVAKLQTRTLKGFEDEEISLWQVESSR